MTLKAGGSLNILHVLRAPVGGLFRQKRSNINMLRNILRFYPCSYLHPTSRPGSGRRG
jgi:hypothetical protein